MQRAVRDRRQAVGRPAELLHQRGVIGSDLAIALLDRPQRLDHRVGPCTLEHAVWLALELALDGRPIQLLDGAIDLQQVANAGAGREVDGRLGIGLRPGQLLPDQVGRIEHEDRVAGRFGRQALAHLLLGVVETLDLGAGLLDQRFRNDKDVAVPLVDPLTDVARVLDVLTLVLPDGHVLRVVEHDVGGHQRRVGQDAGADPFASLPRRSILELGHALQPADRGEALEDPGQLRVRGDVRLDEHRLVGFDPAGQVDGGEVEGVFAERGRVLRQRDGVQVDDAKDVVVLVLVADPVADCAEVVANVEATARLDAAEDSWLRCRLHPRMLRNAISAGPGYIRWIVYVKSAVTVLPATTVTVLGPANPANPRVADPSSATWTLQGAGLGSSGWAPDESVVMGDLFEVAIR